MWTNSQGCLLLPLQLHLWPPPPHLALAMVQHRRSHVLFQPIFRLIWPHRRVKGYQAVLELTRRQEVWKPLTMVSMVSPWTCAQLSPSICEHNPALSHRPTTPHAAPTLPLPAPTTTTPPRGPCSGKNLLGLRVHFELCWRLPDKWCHLRSLPAELSNLIVHFVSGGTF